MNPLLNIDPEPKTLAQRGEAMIQVGRALSFLAFLTLMQNTADALFKRQIEKKIANGETVWLDDYAPPISLPPEQVATKEQPTADISPNQKHRQKKSRAIKLEAYPEPKYPFAYRKAPLSGNVINGLHDTAKRAARRVFHSNGYKIAWNGLERYFHIHVSQVSVKTLQKVTMLDRFKNGRPAPNQYKVTDPQEMADHTKEAAKEFGAELVGITHMSPEHAFEHFDASAYPTAISIAVSMDLDGLHYATSEKSSAAVMDGYHRATKASIALARRIRALGWEAISASNVGADTAEVLHLPLAVQAGLGQLGKHGSLISREFGSNMRLATVLTNMPLAHDQPEDIGVDDFCQRCQICVTNCPPQAIFTEKQMVRGEEKWYVDFDKCVPYFAANNSCGICVAVCPWTESGNGERISLKMLAQKNTRSNA